MSRKILVVVDVQKDFVTGSLGSKEAAEMMPAVIDYVAAFDGEVVYTLDTHSVNYMETQEGKNLPVPHCIKGTPGWGPEDGLEDVLKKKNAVCFEKVTFSSKDLALYLEAENSKEKIDEIVLIGLCTDICVVSNALTIKGFLPETQLTVVEELTEATSREMKAKTLDVLRCCQVKIV
ncbi:MAG: cysteine hydrolase [Lachnospiraceae bacterium]|nr:cysteine hydrolase [Lachnospiraceae bacterium]